MAKTRTFTEAPRTRATTAIGILKAVVKAIREEPRRYDQSDWLCRWTPDDVEWMGRERMKRLPACGTVGCVAGWVEVLTRDTHPRKSWELTVHTATRVLGLTTDQAGRLFSGGALNGSANNAKPGTRAYVNAGIRHIEKFMRDELGYTGPKL